MDRQVVDERIDAPLLTTRAAVRPASIDAEARTVEVVFSTGARSIQSMPFSSLGTYQEELSLNPKHVRMDRLQSGYAPVLIAHNDRSIDAQVGVVEAARLENGQGLATLRFAKGDPTADAIWNKIQQRILRNISVGYRVHTYEKSRGAHDDELPLLRATDWEPYELSVVAMPADAGAHIRADHHSQTNPCVIVTCAEETPAMDEMTPQQDAATAVLPANPTDPGAPMPNAPTQRLERAITDRDAGAAGERERCQGIIRAVRNARFDSSLADQLIAEGKTLEQAATFVLEKLGEMDPPGPTVNAARGVVREAEGYRVVMGDDIGQRHIRAGIENALLHRMAPEYFPLIDVGRTYAGSSMLDLAKYCLQGRGARTTGMSKMDIAAAALGLHLRAGLHTTSDYAIILEDVANKMLRRAYDEAPQTYTAIARRIELPELKPVRRIQIGEAPALLEVLEHGEFTRGTIGEAKETFQLRTFGRVFGITRQALVNDDTDSFSRLAMMFGRTARNLESDLVWAQITSNPTMSDTVALFHATHGNLASVNAAIDVGPLGIARAAMRNQKGLDGVTYLNVTPKYLVVPPGKETLADQFTTNLTPATGANVNPFSGRLTVVAEPRLERFSATAWYLFASTDQVDMVEYGFLAGENGPAVESRVGFDIDGLEVKCRHDVAAKVIDWRGMFKNLGV